MRFAEQVKRGAGILTAAVGMITDPQQAEAVVAAGEADLVLLARQILRDPYWPLHAARRLGAEPSVPVPYQRAFWTSWHNPALREGAGGPPPRRQRAKDHA